MTIGNEYFRRQAVTLLKIAQTTTDSAMAVVLVEKAAKFNAHIHETIAPQDRNSFARPDCED
jgi:hypothetical protein